ncbi:TetR/AcrR family transcriptional regulator [Actinocorallia herbida]|uniref:TetR/AcrR family transcriptional regulator n=1 Tax=Actinocorallia herbida TaxID=58109 RepID=UPI001476E4DF|nr:TetR/AcrR family transcriptional regulator [Actinocorallia herbida]
MANQRGRGRPAGPGVDPEQRRADLLDAAEEALRLHGPTASLSDMARASGYARSAVYAVFPSRPAVLAALGHRHADRLMAAMLTALGGPGPAEDRFHAMLDVLFAWAEREPSLYRALARPPDGPATGSPARPGTPGARHQAHGYGPGTLVTGLAEAIEAMLTATGTPPELAAPSAQAMLGSATAAIDWWLAAGAALPRAALVTQIGSLAWHGGAELLASWFTGPSEP